MASTSYNGSGVDSPIASTSAATRPAPPPAAFEHADLYADLGSHLLDAWVKPHESFADCILRVAYADGSEGVFTLHGLLVSRSPLLHSLLSAAFLSSGPAVRPVVLPLALPDPAITPHALSLVLASLYSPAVLRHLDESTAPAVLATAHFLALDKLAERALALCEEVVKRATTADEVKRWVEYVDREAAAAAQGGGPGGSSLSGRSSPLVPNGAVGVNGALPLPGSVAGWGSTGAGAGAGPHEARLRTLLMDRIVCLPDELGAFEPHTAAAAQQELIPVLARLPFAMVKQAIEDSRFNVPTDLDRFNFAKKVVAARKQLAVAAAQQQQQQQGGGGAGGAVDFEETVVLQFGASSGPGGGCAVNVLRKARKPQLWKASSAA
ncbi:hypothetical protein JCM3775_001961 [Rhodotorula graminis]|uniref:Uncharacterized protein n=1 Tax=Rhodotorula graminis (strain WP1) TaxID=578459 RepID=A0A194S4W3_RHOGW|nr:uncharacterized protein RHOBADRAFT_52806 [Rhodotorula graminis WP1]KPV75778.1 hypothetical protein RHOBADRAFT_52806 [Rhodotorula graminis WP1]